jgi:hypothetical protein
LPEYFVNKSAQQPSSKSAIDVIVGGRVHSPDHSLKLWLENASAAPEKNRQAKEFLKLAGTDDGRKALLDLAAIINTALNACAFQLPSQDEESKGAFLAITTALPSVRWAIEYHVEALPLEDINPLLKIPTARRAARSRRDQWLGRAHIS